MALPGLRSLAQSPPRGRTAFFSVPQLTGCPASACRLICTKPQSSPLASLAADHQSGGHLHASRLQHEASGHHLQQLCRRIARGKHTFPGQCRQILEAIVWPQVHCCHIDCMKCSLHMFVAAWETVPYVSAEVLNVIPSHFSRFIVQMWLRKPRIHTEPSSPQTWRSPLPWSTSYSSYSSHSSFSSCSSCTSNSSQVKFCSDYRKRLIHFSTCEVYGKTLASFLPRDSPLRQDPAYYKLSEDSTPCIFGPVQRQRWSYACAKQLIERLIYGGSPLPAAPAESKILADRGIRAWVPVLGTGRDWRVRSRLLAELDTVS